MMKSFFQSNSCLPGLHCHKCRKYVTGAGFRTSIAENYQTQQTEDGGNECNYACPPERGGKPWIMEGAEQVVSLSVSAATKRAVLPPLTPEEQAARRAEAERRAAEAEAAERAALPSAWERVKKGSVGLTKVALGIDRSSDELIAARKAICEQCPWLVGSTCKKCGCAYAAKIRLSTEECPIQKW